MTAVHVDVIPEGRIDSTRDWDGNAWKAVCSECGPLVGPDGCGLIWRARYRDNRYEARQAAVQHLNERHRPDPATT